MTKSQFNAACKRHGFRAEGFMGYYSLPGTNTLVPISNAGNRRRSQLAYLIQQQRLFSKQRPAN